MENTVVINISGTKFEVSVNTFNNMMSTESDAKLKLDILKENNPSCYFLERNFGVFTAVLSYFQGNGLHVPALTCIAEFKKELDFWGIDPQEIEPCCYSKYIGFFDDQKALTILTDDQSERITERTELQRRVKATGWLSIQAKVWSVLEEPSFNMFAKVGIQKQNHYHYYTILLVVFIYKMYFKKLDAELFQNHSFLMSKKLAQAEAKYSALS